MREGCKKRSKKINLSKDIRISKCHKNLKLLAKTIPSTPVDTFVLLFFWLLTEFLDWKLHVCNRQFEGITDIIVQYQNRSSVLKNSINNHANVAETFV